MEVNLLCSSLILVLGILSPIIIALYVYHDAKKRGLSTKYTRYPIIIGYLPIVFCSILWSIPPGIPVPIVGFAIGVYLSLPMNGIFIGAWIFYVGTKHPLLKTQVAQQPAPPEKGIKKPEMPVTMHEEYLFLCPQCKKGVQAEWTICPYCKTLLKPEVEETQSKRRQSVMNTMEELLGKESNFFVEDIKGCLSKDDVEGAEKLLGEKKRLYGRFLELKKGMGDIDKRTAKLSTKLAEGEVTSDAYERAREDLEREKRDIEEEMWRIQRKIFREKYEKPF